MKVISIGYGRQLFEEKNIERSRLELCSKVVDSLDMIIFTRKSDELETTKISEKFILHPTNSRNRLLMLFDAYGIITKLLAKKTNEKIVLSTQDPFEIGLLGLILAKRHKVTLQVQEHADVYSNLHWRNESPLNFFRYYLGIWVLKNADLIRVVSVRTEKRLGEGFGLGDKIRRLPVAINVEDTGERSTETHLIENPGNFTFLSVGRFVPQKNLPLMLTAFRKVWERNREVRLQIVGGGTEGKKIKALVEELFRDSPNDPPVQISPWCDDVTDLMKRADAYLLTSNYEGWARVLVEAVVFRLPLVTTDVGCVGEVVLDNVHGRVVPVCDEEALVAAMEQMINDQEYYRKIKKNLQSIKIAEIPGTDFEHYGTEWLRTLA